MLFPLLYAKLVWWPLVFYIPNYYTQSLIFCAFQKLLWIRIFAAFSLVFAKLQLRFCLKKFQS